MAYTGGKLNYLNEKRRVNTHNKTVSVMKLIREHKPKSRQELVDLIEYHHKNECSCGVVSKGTIEDFGRNLYEAQLKEWGEYLFTLEECTTWQYNLFVVQSLKGRTLEIKARDILQSHLPTFKVIDTNPFLDFRYRIDLLIENPKGNVVGGIQVKPYSFKYVDPKIKSVNRELNQDFPYPVWYMYYDSQEEFNQVGIIIKEIKEIYATKSGKKNQLQ
jgi:hypothetical protein